MIRNYFLTAIRRLRNNKILTVINIGGLTIALSAFLIIGLYLEAEFSYDRFHENADRIFRVTTFKKTPEASFYRAESSLPLAPALKVEFPEIERAVRIMKTDALFRYNNVVGQQDNLVFADPQIFEVFTFNWVKGDRKTSLIRPFSIVLTEEIALRYFANEDPIGKMIIVDGKQQFYVTGVVQSLPDNSHFNFEALLSMSTAEAKDSGYDWLFTNWYSEACHTYLLLNNSNDATSLGNKLKDFAHHHKEGDDTEFAYSLEKLTDIYLHSTADDQFGNTGSITNIYAFSAIALFIILIASINYINIVTSQSAERAKEIGIRKVIGASRRQLQKQFLAEALLVTSLSSLLALCICQLVLPIFNDVSGKRIVLDVNHANYLFYAVLIIVVLSVLSAFVPALVISTMRTVQSLKGNQKIKVGGIRLREGLVVIQFALSAGLIVGCLVVYHQLYFVDHFNAGFARDQIVVLKTHGDRNINSHLDVFKGEMLQVSGVEKVSASSLVPGDGKSGWSMEIADKGRKLKTEMPVFLIDDDFLDLYDIPVIEGRELSDKFASDTIESMLLNESAVKSLGFRTNEEVIGMTIDMYPSVGKVVGVFKDFNFESLHKKIEPLAVRNVPGMMRKVSVRLKTADVKSAIIGIQAKWAELVPERPMEYSFLDEDFDNQYKAETRFGEVFIVFTILAVVIACVGLYGLSLITTQQRRKEIGIRKIVGASSAQLVILLTKDFVRLVLVGLFVSFPVAYYLMNVWLSQFSYHIQISSGIFFIATGISMSIAMATVFFQTLKTAMENPTESLRSE